MEKLNNSFEGSLVDYYEQFFFEGDKAKREVDYILEMANELLEDRESIIDVGCGTGIHDLLFSRKFKKVLAIDISSDMIKYAYKHNRGNNIIYKCSDVRDCEGMNYKTKFAVSLSHVIGYQLRNCDVESFLSSISKFLERGGYFLFNFYNFSGIYLGDLKPRHIIKNCGEKKISRISNAEINYLENCLDLDYYYIVNNDSVNQFYEIHEKMRFFSICEIKYFLEKCGLEALHFFSYGKNEKLVPQEWNAGCIALKK